MSHPSTHYALLFSFIFSFIARAENQAQPELKNSQAQPQIQITPETTLGIFADFDSHKVTSPTALCIDEKGRVLVTETWRFGENLGIDDNRRRRHWLLEDISSQTTDDRMKMFEKWYHKHPKEIYTKNSEKIRQLVDTNQDGKADKMTLFADGFNHPLDGTAAGIFSYRGNIYFACIPHIWLLKDNDDDGKAESQKSLQDGFGVRTSLSGHDLNGFALGPDGRIYATIGDRGFNIKTKEGKHYAYPDQGAILRFEPDGSYMEVIHTGLRNPKEIAFDKFGNPITVDNNSDQGDQARIVYIMEGADSGWRMDYQVMTTFSEQAGFKKRPLNRWLQEEIWRPRSKKHINIQPSFIIPPLMNLTNGPSGLTYHPGPKSYPGKDNHFLITDYKGAAARSMIHSFEVVPEGAGMKVSENFIFNQGAAVTDAEYGYDDRLYVTDFIGGWASSKQGRVYTIENTQKAQESDSAELIAQDFTSLSSKMLLSLLANPDMRIRLRAHIALAEKKDTESLGSALTDKNSSLITKLHGVWGLGIIARKGGAEAKTATASLITAAHQTQETEIKARIAEALGEAIEIEKMHATLMKLLNDESSRVRSFAAISLGKLEHKPAFNVLVKQIADNNNQDAFLRHALVMGILGAGSADQIVALKNHSSSSVHLAAVIALRRLKHPALAHFLDKSPLVRDAAIRAIHDCYIEEARPELVKLLEKYSSSDSLKLTPIMQLRLIHSAFRIGGDNNIKTLIRLIDSKNPSIDSKLRAEAVRVLAHWNKPPIVDQSLGRIAPLKEREDNIVSLLKKHLPSLIKVENTAVAELIDLATSYGIQNDALPIDKLIKIAKDESLSSKIRSAAINALAKNPPVKFSALLLQLADDQDAQVAITCLDAMQRLNLSSLEKALIKSITISKQVPLRQRAWAIIQEKEKLSESLTTSLKSALAKLPTKQADQHAALEISQAAEKHLTKSKEWKVYQATIDPKDPVAPFLITLMGGDAANGKVLFRNHPAAQCSRCHTFFKNHDLEMAGPNLSNIAKNHNAFYLLQAIVDPNATIAKGYSPGMPPMGLLMKKEEIRDVLAFLKTLK